MILILLTPGFAAACFNPTDSFATEVVLNNPNITYSVEDLRKSDNITLSNGLTAYRSHYNSSVGVLVYEVKDLNLTGLSVKIQIPTKIVDMAIPIYEINLNKSIIIDSLNFAEAVNLGWNHTSLEKSHELRKNNIGISVFQSGALTNVLVRINDVTTFTEHMRVQISEVLWKIGFASSQSTALSGAEEGSRVEQWTDLESAVDINPEEFDFGEAMMTELYWLKENGVISITDSDIQEISQTSERGLAGHNSRIVYDEGEWKPYFETDNPLLLREGPSCVGFSEGRLPAGDLITMGEIYEQVPSMSWPILTLIVLGGLAGSYYIYKRYYF